MNGPYWLDYIERVRSIRPHNLIGIWPQFEKAGGVCFDLAKAIGNGAYTGVTLGEPGPGDWYGHSVTHYDGALDYDNVLTGAAQSLFNGDEGSLIVPARVNGEGVWTDGTRRRVFHAQTEAPYYHWLSIYKNNSPDDQMVWQLHNGNTHTITKDNMTETGWIWFGYTWSKSGNRVVAYYHGSEENSSSHAGTWAGALTHLLVGAGSTTPANPWHGWVGPVVLLNAALDGEEMRYLVPRL